MKTVKGAQGVTGALVECKETRQLWNEESYQSLTGSGLEERSSIRLGQTHAFLLTSQDDV